MALEYRSDSWNARYRRLAAWSSELTRAMGSDPEFALSHPLIAVLDGRRRAEFLEDLGIRGYFEQVVISSEVGADKPSLKIFREALSRFQVPADEMLHVGDDEATDGAGARAAGIQAVIVDDSEHSFEQVFARIHSVGSVLPDVAKAMSGRVLADEGRRSLARRRANRPVPED